MASDEAGEDFAEIGFGIDVVQFALRFLFLATVYGRTRTDAEFARDFAPWPQDCKTARNFDPTDKVSQRIDLVVKG